MTSIDYTVEYISKEAGIKTITISAPSGYDAVQQAAAQAPDWLKLMRVIYR